MYRTTRKTRTLTKLLTLAGLACASTSAMGAENIDVFAVSDATPYPGQTITVTVNTSMTAPGDVWTSTYINMIESDGVTPVFGSGLCVNQPDPDLVNPPVGTYQEVITYTVPAGLADGNYFVRAVGFMTTDDCNGAGFIGTMEDSFAVTVAAQADLALTSNGDDPDPILAGEPLSGQANLRHSFTLTNGGPNDAASVSVDFSSSTWPSGVSFVTAIPESGTFANNVWTVGSLASGADLDISLYYVVDSSAASCSGCISVSGTASAATTDPGPGLNTASESTSIDAPVDQGVAFATSIDFDNDATDSVTVTLGCNAGLPLEQSFEISEGSDVTFSMTNLPYTTPGIRCEITATDAAGYALTAVANSGASADSCVYEADSFTGSFNLQGNNDCVFTATPGPTTITVKTLFENYPNDDIASAVDTDFETVITCQGASETDGSSFGEVEDTDTSGAFTADWYADPDGGADCTVVLYPDSDAVEGDSCEFSFAVGDEEAGCDVVGTVFFEGVPTLGRYGMALMALLMLGVGFIAVRRFA